MASVRSLRLLVVEDEGILAFMLSDMLEELGHHVAFIAANIQEAIAIIEEHAAELDGCVLDANLGGEIATPIAMSLRRARLPFIVVSGYDMRDLQRFDLIGPVVSKPYNMQDLASALTKI